MKAVIYARVSTEKQEDQQTIESQIAEDKELIQKNNDVLVEIYSDDGYSGAILARPALDRLRDDIKSKLFDRIYIHNPDRLARKYAYQALILDEFKRANIEVVFKNMKSAKTDEDQMLLGIQGVVAEFEKCKILERTRRGRLFRAKSNHVIGNIPPYGYKCISKHQSDTKYAQYVIDADESSVVKSIFKWFVEEHLTTYGLVSKLHSLGLLARKGKPWAKSSIYKILRNETYVGTTYYNKHVSIPSNKPQQKDKYLRREHTLLRFKEKSEWIPIDVPSIISREHFESAQNQLKQNALMSDRNAKQTYILKGLVSCGNDMASMYGVPMHGKRYYRCNYKNRLVSPIPCKSSIVYADRLESVVWDIVSELLSNSQLIESQYHKWVEQYQKNIEAQNIGLDMNNKIEHDILQLKNEENKLLQAYTAGIITLDQLKEQNKHILERKSELDNKRNLYISTRVKVIDTIPEHNDFERYAHLFKTVLNKFEPEKKQLLLRKAQIKIVVLDRKVTIKGIIPTTSNVLLCPQPPS